MPDKSAAPYVLPAGEGRAFWFASMHRVEKAETASTRGAFAVSEVTTDAGYASPPHVHSREDEALYVLDGKVDIYLGGGVTRAEPGAWVFMPRGIPHSWIVDHGGPARLLIMVCPAGFEQFYVKYGTPAELGRPDEPPLTREQVTRIMADEFGVELVAPPPDYPTTNV